MYTNEGLGARRAPSPLLEWCRANKAECLSGRRFVTSRILFFSLFQSTTSSSKGRSSDSAKSPPDVAIRSRDKLHRGALVMNYI